MEWSICAKPVSSLHLDGIIGVEGEDDPLLTGNSGTISRVEKDEEIKIGTTG